MLVYAIATLTFSIVTLAAWQLLQPRENVLQRRLAGNAPVDYRNSPQEGESSFNVRVIRPLQQKVRRLWRSSVPHNAAQGLERRIKMAGMSISVPGYMAIWAASALAGIGFFVFVVSVSHPTASRMIFTGLAMLPMPILGPYLVLSIRVRRRQQAIVRALPDSMDLLVTSVEAGLGVDSAISLVADRTQGPLSDSFRLYINQVNLGRTRSAALQHMADSTGVKQLRGLVINVMRGEELGITIGDVLRRHAADLRLERRDRAREAAYRAPVLMTIPLVLCFLPAMGAVIVVPMVLNLLEFVGQIGR